MNHPPLDPTQRNIVITGFMGSGKTTVGRCVAERLQRPFVDMDDVLVAEFGKSITAVFEEDGEGVFRSAEAQLCQRLAQERGLVISTGGGALLNADSRAALGASGVLVCLQVSPAVIERRLAADQARPLLAGEAAERSRRIHQLLRQRRAAYRAIPYQVDTDDLSPEQAAARVIEAAEADAEAAGMLRIPVRSPDGSYDLLLGQGLLQQAGDLLVRRGVHPHRTAIVTNAQIRGHADLLAASLRGAGFQPTLVTVPEGEQFKTLETVRSIYEQLLAAGLDRRSTVIALGGGVIGDMAGFAAATYLRGVPFVQIPTSLLAMVDASVGGKTGVDLPQGKNLIGAFKMPQVVLMDTATLATLPSDEFRAGLAEVVKHGIIGAPRLFAELEEEGPASLQQLVADAVRVKVNVVEADPYESGLRAVLNLGHTFGHALELVSEFTLRHGEAVAVGLVAAAHLAADLDYCAPALAERITHLIERLGLPTAVEGYAGDAVYAAMGHDKKRSGKILRFIVPRALGDVTIIDDPGEPAIRRALAKVVL